MHVILATSHERMRYGERGLSFCGQLVFPDSEYLAEGHIPDLPGNMLRDLCRGCLVNMSPTEQITHALFGAA